MLSCMHSDYRLHIHVLFIRMRFFFASVNYIHLFNMNYNIVFSLFLSSNSVYMYCFHIYEMKHMDCDKTISSITCICYFCDGNLFTG